MWNRRTGRKRRCCSPRWWVLMLATAGMLAAVPTRGVASADTSGGYASGIVVMNADGSEQRNLTTSAEGSPSWSPDGTRIAFDWRPGQDYHEIWMMKVDGSNRRNLTNHPAIDTEPAWSPNGTKIAFTNSRDSETRDGVTYTTMNVYVMKSDGSGVTRLTTGWTTDSDPAWSPDGRRIAWDHNGEIWVMNGDGTGSTNLTNHPAIDRQPTWSPDGTKIAFTSNRDGDGNYDIYVMNADGSDVQRLTTDPGEASGPAWSPDGRKITFSKSPSLDAPAGDQAGWPARRRRSSRRIRAAVAAGAPLVPRTLDLMAHARQASRKVAVRSGGFHQMTRPPCRTLVAGRCPRLPSGLQGGDQRRAMPGCDVVTADRSPAASEVGT